MSGNLPALIDDPGDMVPSQSLKDESLAALRRKAVKWITHHIETDSTRKAAIEELAYVLVAERLHREEILLLKHLEEKKEHQIRLLTKLQEYKRAKLTEQKKLQLAVSDINAKIASNLSRTRHLLSQPATQTEAVIERAKGQLARMKAQQALKRHLQDAYFDSLENQATHRANFLTHVREKYPDLKDEIMDEYDRNVHDFNQTSQALREED